MYDSRATHLDWIATGSGVKPRYSVLVLRPGGQISAPAEGARLPEFPIRIRHAALDALPSITFPGNKVHPRPA